MPRTIGPCRPTSAVKAASPAGSWLPAVYRSRSCTVGEPSDRAALEERLELPDNGTSCHVRHAWSLSRCCSDRRRAPAPRTSITQPLTKYCHAAGRIVPNWESQIRNGSGQKKLRPHFLSQR